MISRTGEGDTYFVRKFKSLDFKISSTSESVRALGYPVLPLIPLLVDTVLVVLFTTADYTGGLVAIGLGLLCIPFALVAHRARRTAAAAA